MYQILSVIGVESRVVRVGRWITETDRFVSGACRWGLWVRELVRDGIRAVDMCTECSVVQQRVDMRSMLRAHMRHIRVSVLPTR